MLDQQSQELQQQEDGAIIEDDRTHSPRSLFFALIFIFAALLVAGAGYVTYKYITESMVEDVIEDESQAEAIREQYEQARTGERSLAFHSAIEDYQQLKASTEDPSEQAQYTIKIGYLHNRAGEYVKATELLKPIAADATLSDEMRTHALLAMVSPYYKARLKEPLQAVFNDPNEPYSSFTVGDLNNLMVLQDGLANLIQYSIEIYPLSYAYYTLANHTSGILLDTPVLTTEEVNDLTAQLSLLIELGDQMLESEVQREDFKSPNLTYDLYFPGQNFRQFNLEALARFDLEWVDQAESEYQRIIDQYDRYTRGASMRVLESYLRFYHAAFLYDVYGEDKYEEIVSILEPVVSQTGEYGESAEIIKEFIRIESTRPESEQGHNYRFIESLRSVYPAFDAYVVEALSQ